MCDDTTPKKMKEPTASEAMFFFAIVKHTKNKADIDWNAVAIEQSFKNAEVAKVRFGQVKRKLGISSDSPGSASARNTPKKVSGSAAATPTKVNKTPSGRVGTKGKDKGKVKKEEIESGPDDEDAVKNSTAVKDEGLGLQDQLSAEMDDITAKNPF